VVEFTRLDEAFPGDETGVLRQVLPVTYDRETIGVTFEPQSHRSIFFAKYRDWSYEQESRVILPLDECRRIRTGERSLYLHDISPEHIRRVIVGWRMSQLEVERVRSVVAEHNPAVGVCQAQLERGVVHIPE
jgi:hypothetical protein